MIKYLEKKQNKNLSATAIIPVWFKRKAFKLNIRHAVTVFVSYVTG